MKALILSVLICSLSAASAAELLVDIEAVSKNEKESLGNALTLCQIRADGRHFRLAGMDHVRFTYPDAQNVITAAKCVLSSH